MKPSQSQIRDLLSVDSLHEAEKLTGKSYKEDEGTSNLGFLMHLDHVQRKRQALAAAEDTHFGITPTWLLAALMKDGFDIVHVEPFVGPNRYGAPYNERYHLLFCPRRSILVSMETYARGSEHNPEGSVNSVHFHFQWRAHDQSEGYWPDIRYSGHGVQDGQKRWVINGHIDGREGMFTMLSYMEDNGEFLTQWIEKPSMLWLNPYATHYDEKGESLPYGKSANRTEELVAKIPAEIRAKLCL